MLALFGFSLMSFLAYFFVIFGQIFSPFWHFFGSWRVSGPPLGRSGVLLGARVPPRDIQGAKHWCLGLPMGSQIGVICWLFLQLFAIENASKNTFIF